MGKARRVRRDREAQEMLRKANEEAGTVHDPEDGLVELKLTLPNIAAEIEASLAEYRSRGCTCNPEVRAHLAKGTPSTDGKPMLHTYFLHEDWCPFLRVLEEGQR